MKKRIIALILLIIFLGVLIYYRDPIKIYYHRVAYFSFCEQPIKYRVDYIDPKFSVTKSDVVNNSKIAAAIWNTEYQETLFEYDPNAKLSVNLVFDERQSLLTKISDNENTIMDQESQLQLKIDEYQDKLEEINQRVEELNKNIAYWNSKGGAPPKEYEKLIKEQNTLKREVEQLNKTAEKLNQTSEALNNKIGSLNAAISDFNELINTKPEEGVFDPARNRIEVYVYEDRNRFIHTLAHEFGHALGLDHLENPESIMYALASDKTSLTIDDQEMLVAYCQEQSKWELVKNDLGVIWSEIIKFYQYTIDSYQSS